MNEYWSAQAHQCYLDLTLKQMEQSEEYHNARTAPHVIHNAQIIKDGNAWLCILGDLPTGVVGVGDTPKQACDDFDRAWYANA